MSQPFLFRKKGSETNVLKNYQLGEWDERFEKLSTFKSMRKLVSITSIWNSRTKLESHNQHLLSIHPFIYLSFLPSIHRSIHSSIHPFIHTSIHPSIHPSIHSFTLLSILPFIHSHFYPSFHSFLHNPILLNFNLGKHTVLNFRQINPDSFITRLKLSVFHVNPSLYISAITLRF